MMSPGRAGWSYTIKMDPEAVPSLLMLQPQTPSFLMNTISTDSSKKRRGRGRNRQEAEEEQQCCFCDIPFKFSDFEQHKRLPEHRIAVERKRRRERTARRTPKLTPADPESVEAPRAFRMQLDENVILAEEPNELIFLTDKTAVIEETEIITTQKDPKIDELKQKYFIRQWFDLPEQNRIFQNTLTAFLCLRFCLDNNIKEIKVSMNDANWKEFGDIVFEITNQQENLEIYAIQCKQVVVTNNILLPTLMAENGKFSLKKQCEALTKLRKKKNYDKTNFVLLTASELQIDVNTRYRFKEETEKWKEGNRKIWQNREFVAVNVKKKHPINTTEEPDNVFSFKFFDDEDKDLNNDLAKFSILDTQKKTKALRSSIQSKIESKFDTTRDITHELIKFISDYFMKPEIFKYKFKLNKEEVLLKIAEVLLTPYIAFPEVTVEERAIKHWEKAVERFDLTVVSNHFDVVNKIYASINKKLKENVDRNLDISLKTLKISQKGVNNPLLRSEMFACFPGSQRKIFLNSLYVMMWKAKCAPLVLSGEEQDLIFWMLRIFRFLKESGIFTNFILLTNLSFSPTFFPNKLSVFLTMEDIKNNHGVWYESLSRKIRIPVLDFQVTLREIAESNVDFLRIIKPDAFINMSLRDFSFEHTTELTDEIHHYTIVFKDEIIEKFRNYFGRIDDEMLRRPRHLQYTVFMDGSAKCIEIPPDI